jgi:hypothetical protein
MDRLPKNSSLNDHGPDVSATPRREYETPEVQTFTPEELLQVLGPAQGYGGGGPPGRRTPGGRGHRLFPGLR